MRVLKLIAGVALAVVALNLLTWAFFGRGSALELAATGFDAWGALDGDDTLVVYAHSQSEQGRWTEPGDVPESGRARIAAAFVTSGAGSNVVYRPESLTALPDSLPDDHFIIAPVVRRDVPFYARSSVAAYAPGFISTRNQRWVWVFGWRPFGYANESVS